MTSQQHSRTQASDSKGRLQVRFAEKVKLQRKLRRAHRLLDEALAAAPDGDEESPEIRALRQSVSEVQADLDVRAFASTPPPPRPVMRSR